MTKLLNEIRQNYKPDIILTITDEITHDVLSCKSNLIKEVPIIFAGCHFNSLLYSNNGPDTLNLKKDFPNVTGRIEPIDFNLLVDLSKQLFPEIEDIGYALGFQYSDFTFRHDYMKRIHIEGGFTHFRPFNYDTINTNARLVEIDTISIKKEHPLIFSEYLFTLSKQTDILDFLEKEKRVIAFKPIEDGTYTQFIRSNTMPLLNINSAFFPPLKYNNYSTTIGGYMTPLEKQYEYLLKTSEKIFSGIDVKNIPIDTSKLAPYFDYVRLKEWGIPLDRLPEGSHIINTPKNYKSYFIALCAMFLILSITSLLRHLYLKKRISKEDKNIKELEKIQNDNTLNLFSNEDTAILIIDSNNLISYANKTALKLLKISDIVSTIGKPFSSAFILEDDSRFHFCFYDALNLIRESKIEYTEPKKIKLHLQDNTVLDIRANISPLKYSNGDNNILFSFIDYTKYEIKNQFISKSMFYNGINQWSLNQNEKKIHILGLNIIVSLYSFIKVIHSDELEKFKSELRTIFKTNDDSILTLQFRIKINSERYDWIECIIHKSFNKINSKNSLYGIFYNINDLKIESKHLEELEISAKKEEAEKDIFLHNISHEIRTPLNAIVGFSNLLIDKGEDPLDIDEKNNIKEIINSNCESLHKIIYNILDLSRIQSDVTFDIQNYTLSDILLEVFNEYKQNNFKNLNLFFNYNRTEIIIATDKKRLQQVIKELLNNAYKFTESGNIIMSYYYNSSIKKFVISIEDNAKAIKDEEKIKIFNYFYKTDSFTEGTGLGLSLSRAIINRLNGRIWVESTDNGSNLFIIEIPNYKNDINEIC